MHRNKIPNTNTAPKCHLCRINTRQCCSIFEEVSHLPHQLPNPDIHVLLGWYESLGDAFYDSTHCHDPTTRTTRWRSLHSYSRHFALPVPFSYRKPIKGAKETNHRAPAPRQRTRQLLRHIQRDYGLTLLHDPALQLLPLPPPAAGQRKLNVAERWCFAASSTDPGNGWRMDESMIFKWCIFTCCLYLYITLVCRNLTQRSEGKGYPERDCIRLCTIACKTLRVPSVPPPPPQQW